MESSDTYKKIIRVIDNVLKEEGPFYNPETLEDGFFLPFIYKGITEEDGEPTFHFEGLGSRKVKREMFRNFKCPLMRSDLYFEFEFFEIADLERISDLRKQRKANRKPKP